MLRSIGKLTVLVLYRYYSPRLFVFYPLYKVLRRQLRLPMVVSNFLVWIVSAVLHGGVLMLTGSVRAGLVFAIIFLFLGLVSTSVIVTTKRGAWSRSARPGIT